MHLPLLLAAALAITTATAEAAPVTAVVTAYEPEWQALLPLMSEERDAYAGGVHFVEGVLAGSRVLLVESGIGPVNAALASQIAVDRFHAQRLLVVGVAGGVDPTLHVGDVVVPEQWGEYLFSVFARSAGDGYKLPGFATNTTEHYGMIFPQPVPVGHAPAATAALPWLAVDAGLLDAARAAVGNVKLDRCRSPGQCLANEPRIVVGGSGVSGPAFVDNADFRHFVEGAFHARAVDMESAAVAHVANANGVPFLAFRSLSDLAGGEAGANEMDTFQALAARNVATAFKAFMERLHEEDAHASSSH